MEKLDAYIIDPEMQSRMRLKQVTVSVPFFGQVYQGGKFKECIDKVSIVANPVSVIFLSYRLDLQEIASFIQQAKLIPGSQDAAFIMVLRSQDREAASVASFLLNGADGFLFEPFSAEELNEITIIASKIKNERTAQREEAALRFLLGDIVNQLDQVAYLKSCSYESGAGMKKLKEMCSVFQTLSPESKELYQRLVVETFENAPLPKLLFQRKKYVGVSSRVQKRLEKKTIDEFGS